MQTKTAKRRELHQMIDTLPDDGVTAMFDFVKNLRLHTEHAEWVDPIETGTWNAETLEAVRELEEGGGVQFETAEELYKDLGI